MARWEKYKHKNSSLPFDLWSPNTQPRTNGGASDSKESACNARDPGQEDSLEKEMATQSSIPAWRIPWTEEPGSLPSTGSQKSQTHLRDSKTTTTTEDKRWRILQSPQMILPQSGTHHLSLVFPQPEQELWPCLMSKWQRCASPIWSGQEADGCHLTWWQHSS